MANFQPGSQQRLFTKARRVVHLPFLPPVTVASRRELTFKNRGLFMDAAVGLEALFWQLRSCAVTHPEPVKSSVIGLRPPNRSKVSVFVSPPPLGVGFLLSLETMSNRGSQRRNNNNSQKPFSSLPPPLSRGGMGKRP